MPMNYQNGKIYTIVNDVNDIIYVGSTANPRLSTRMSQHRSMSNDATKRSGIYRAMRTLGVDHFRIVLHHPFSCQSKDELFAEEMKTLDADIAAGKSVYNSMIGGKHDAATKAKIGRAQLGRPRTEETKKKISDSTRGSKASSFSFGCIRYEVRSDSHRWTFEWNEDGKAKKKSFGVYKHGFWQAKLLAEDERKKVYPEWGTEEDCTCDDFGEIEWD